MSIEWSDLPTLESANRLGRRSSGSAVAEAYSSSEAGAGVELSSLYFSVGVEAMQLLQDKIFPSSRYAGVPVTAAGVTYTTYSDCGGFHYGGMCANPCFGYAADHMASFYCATCAEQKADPANNPAWNWHFTGSRGQYQYRDQPSNPCNGKDAWKWKVGACGNCTQNAVFRCHDGYKKRPNSTVWEPTICEGLISCDNKLTSCP
jgi:hypothetical protein